MRSDFPVVRSSKNQPGQPADLLSLFKAGDPVICRRFQRLAYALSCEHLARNGCADVLLHQEAREVAQEVICRLFLFEYDDREVDAPVETVLLSFVRRVWHETQRERRKMTLVEPEAVGLAQLPDDWLVASERQLVVEALLQAYQYDLKTPCRAVFDLRYFFNKTIADIAGALKLSVSGVDTRLLRCRRVLKDIAKIRLSRLYGEAESAGQYF